MKKLLWIFPVLLLFLTPALAQHGRQQSGNQRGNERHETRQRVDREPREHKQAVREHRDEYRASRAPREQHQGEARHEGGGWFHRGGHDREFERRDHWNGRRFDDDYFRGHWGNEHRFYWHHCRWYGPRFMVGSRFYYGGGWFIIVDPIPDYWGDDYVYIDDIDGVYYLVNPLYPQRIVINVVF